jgi:putative phosphoesterase
VERVLAIRIGVISDTHGLLRPAAIDVLRGSDLIVHAGDIGDPSILHALSRLAPVTAVRGNNDFGDWADALREVETLELGSMRIGVVHDAKSLTAAQRSRWNAVVAGHSHRPLCDTRDGVLHFNPGSAGPRRFTLPVSVGEILVERGTLAGRIIGLSA